MPFESEVLPRTVPRLWDCSKLKDWRREADLSREQVAADLQRLGQTMTVSWLVQIEHGTSGQRSVGFDTVIQLCRYYGHHVSELVLPEAA